MSDAALGLLKDILERLESVEKELGLQREDFRLVRTELRQQHEHISGLFGVTPAEGIEALSLSAAIKR